MSYRSLLRVVILALTIAYGFQVKAQVVEKVVIPQTHFWISTNNVYRFSDKFALLSDVHIRRTDFMKNPSFYFLRGGARFWLEPKMHVSGGYAHMWLAPTTPGWTTFADENRLYQEMVMVGFFNKSSVLFRIRNEQRWREKIENDMSTGNYGFNTRLRMLVSISIPLSENPKVPKIMVANEIHINLGKQVVFNTFDQNRFTIGINHRISKQWRYDFGYMAIYQEQSNGFTYNLNHTIRLFFYGGFDFRKKIPVNEPVLPRFGDE